MHVVRPWSYPSTASHPQAGCISIDFQCGKSLPKPNGLQGTGLQFFGPLKEVEKYNSTKLVDVSGC